jgi:hypothetical protein
MILFVISNQKKVILRAIKQSYPLVTSMDAAGEMIVNQNRHIKLYKLSLIFFQKLLLFEYKADDKIKKGIIFNR